MKKFSLLTAVLLLSCVWAVAQTSPSSSSPSSAQPSTQSPSSTTTSPSSTSPTAQQPDTSTSGANASASSTDKGNAIEGCLSGSAGNFTLTDASGTAYQLAGDTSKLSDHVGHQVRVWGDNSGAGASSATGTSASSAPSTFTVKRVKMVSSTCSNK